MPLALAATGLLVLVIVAAVLMARGQGPAALPSPTPSPSASVGPGASVSASPVSPTASAAASPSATPAASTAATAADYGFISLGQFGTFAIRAESDGRVVRELTGINPAVSPDGKTIAYWRTGPAAAVPHVLTVHTVATGAERTLYEPQGQRGAGIVWASDARGLLFAVETPRAGGPPSGPERSSLLTYDLAASQAPVATSSELMLTGGIVILPVAWDGPGQVASAVLTGEGGFATEYLTWDQRIQAASASAVRRTRMPWSGIIAGTVRGSWDHKLVLAPDRERSVLRIWPIADIAASGEVRPAPGATVGSAEWRPRSQREVAWAPGGKVDLFAYQTDSTRTIHTAPEPLFVMTWRADGSAVVVYEGQARRLVLVDVASGRATPLAWAPQTGDTGNAGNAVNIHKGVLLR